MLCEPSSAGQTVSDTRPGGYYGPGDRARDPALIQWMGTDNPNWSKPLAALGLVNAGQYTGILLFDQPVPRWDPSFACYLDMAGRSAAFTRGQRAAVRRASGLPPLYRVDEDIFYSIDFINAWNTFRRNDLEEAAGGGISGPDMSFDGFHPYSPEQIAQFQLEARLKAVQDMEAAALAKVSPGLSPAQALVVSQTYATDPLGHQILNSFVTQVVASGTGTRSGGAIDDVAAKVLAGPSQTQAALSLLPIDPAVKARADLPAGLGNVLTQGQEASRIATIGTDMYQSTSGSYRASETAAIEEKREATDYLYWKDNYPVVELKPEDNPTFDPNLLRQPYDGNVWEFTARNGAKVYGWGGGLVNKAGNHISPQSIGGRRVNPPLTFLRATPKQKPVPKLGWMAANPWVAQVLSVIPLVGQYLGMIWKISAASQARNYAMAWQTPVSAFQPQYVPQPFYVILPLDRAKRAQMEPWYLPILHKQFQSQIQAASLNLMGFAA